MLQHVFFSGKKFQTAWRLSGTIAQSVTVFAHMSLETLTQTTQTTHTHPTHLEEVEKTELWGFVWLQSIPGTQSVTGYPNYACDSWIPFFPHRTLASTSLLLRRRMLTGHSGHLKRWLVSTRWNSLKKLNLVKSWDLELGTVPTVLPVQRACKMPKCQGCEWKDLSKKSGTKQNKKKVQCITNLHWFTTNFYPFQSCFYPWNTGLPKLFFDFLQTSATGLRDHVIHGQSARAVHGREGCEERRQPRQVQNQREELHFQSLWQKRKKKHENTNITYITYITFCWWNDIESLDSEGKCFVFNGHAFNALPFSSGGVIARCIGSSFIKQSMQTVTPSSPLMRSNNW